VTDARHPLETLHPRSLKHLTSHLEALVKERLWAKVIVGMLLGVVAGIALGPSVRWVSPEVATLIGAWAALPGKVFLGLIQMIVVPLIVASIIRGLASTENLEQLRKLGVRTTLVFAGATFIALAIGLGLVLLVRPGQFIDPTKVRTAFEPAVDVPTASPSIPDIVSLPATLSELLPTNPLGAMVEGQMLPVVLFAILLAVALVTVPARDSRPILELLGSLQSISMTVVSWAVKLAPYAVFGLMTRLMASVGPETLIGLGAYGATVIGGLVLLGAVYVGVAAVATRRSPLKFWADARDVLLLAFSTSSSAAVMPMSVETAEEALHVRPGVARMVIPLGATINMGGTALYQVVATYFLAQMFGVELGTTALLLVVLTALGASVGASATPAVAMLVLAMVLRGVGIPLGGIALVLAVDRLLDMVRTAVNVGGDLAVCAVVDRWLGSDTDLVDLAEIHAQERALERQRSQSGADVVISSG
jgi:Na+/H+-dicarboxylate symporter